MLLATCNCKCLGAVSSGDLAGSNRFSDHQYYQMRRKNGYEPVVNGMIIMVCS